MSPRVERLKKLLAELDSEELSEVAHFLLEALGYEWMESDQEILEPSREEIARRVEEIRSGRVQGIPFEEVMERLRKEFPEA